MTDNDSPQQVLVPIMRGGTPAAAHSFVLFLEERGIRAVIESDRDSLVAIEDAISVVVFVNSEDQQKAEQALVDFQNEALPADEATDDAKDDDTFPRLAWKEWPRCPACSRLRLAECPTCGEKGDDFSLSEYQEKEAPPEPALGTNPGAAAAKPTPLFPLLVCPNCTEAFRPIFDRHCVQCGRVFVDANLVPELKPTASPFWEFVLYLTYFSLFSLFLGVLGTLYLAFMGTAK